MRGRLSNPRPLDYASRGIHRVTVGRRRAWVLVAAALVTLLFVPFGSVRQTRSRIDAVSGSMEWQTTWILGFTSGPRIDASPLELRLRKLGITWARDWRFLHNTHRTLGGNTTCYECGTAPPIYGLHALALGDLVRVYSDDQIVAFVQVMQSGTEDQQEAAIGLAADAILGVTPTRTPP